MTEDSARLPAVCRLLREYAAQRRLSNAEIARRIEQMFGVVRSRAAVSQVMNGGVPSRKSPVLGLASRPKREPPLAFLIASVLEVPSDLLHRAIEEDLAASPDEPAPTRSAISLPDADRSVHPGDRLRAAEATLEHLERTLSPLLPDSATVRTAIEALTEVRAALSDVRAALEARESPKS